MILYCDTSALVKLYVLEEASAVVRERANTAQALAVARVAWAEIMAALARRLREHSIDAAVIEAIRHQIRADWPNFAVVETTQPLVELAGDYADTFALRAYDAIQLASARTLQAAADEPVCFACFDQRLQKAAAILGMQTLG